MAVLCADMVSYTRLMEADEVETHRRLRSLKVSVIDPIVVSNRGEVVKGTGDGFIAVYESPRDALQSACEMQTEVAQAEAEQSPETRLVFRMGLHWEPVIFDDHDVYGSVVNIACRLQALGQAGGVITSKALLDVIDGDSPVPLDDLGEIRLRNLSRPVHAYALKLAGAQVSPGLGSTPRRVGSVRLPSLAVLPFINLSPDENTDFIASGFAEEVIATLSTVPELLVVSRASTINFDAATVDADLVTEKLGVRYVLRGSVWRRGENVRIGVSFIDCDGGAVIWAERYNIGIGEIFSLQYEVALKVAGKIARGIQRSEIHRSLRASPQKLNAYDYFIRALDLLYKLDYESFSQARELLQAAQEEDPGYAAPYAYSAHWHMFNICEGWSYDADVDAEQFMSYARQALERDRENALALSIQGHGRSMFFGEHEAAIDMFDRALSASPSNSWAWVFSSGTYGFIGDPAAGVARAERAIRLSPLDQQAFFNYCLLAQNHYLNGSFQEAARWSRRSLDLNARFGNAMRILAASLVALGDPGKAAEIARHHNRALPGFALGSYAKRCPFKPDDARLYLERLSSAGITR